VHIYVSYFLALIYASNIGIEIVSSIRSIFIDVDNFFLLFFVLTDLRANLIIVIVESYNLLLESATMESPVDGC